MIFVNSFFSHIKMTTARQKYIIDRLIGRVRKGKAVFFKVLWEGGDVTIERRANLVKDVPHMVRDFEDARRYRRDRAIQAATGALYAGTPVKCAPRPDEKLLALAAVSSALYSSEVMAHTGLQLHKRRRVYMCGPLADNKCYA